MRERLFIFGCFIVLCGSLFLVSGSSIAKADYESVGIREAQHKYRDAHRATLRAEAREREARTVLDATRRYIAQYGKNVGRWVWLANSVGWPGGSWGQLFYVIDRESGGSPKALNASSGAAGLLQFLPQWFSGAWGGKAFDPFNPRENLFHGHLLWEEQGWQPWAL